MTTIVTRAGKGSALTWVEGDANFTNLNNAKLENVVEDLTPQLGGSLDVNGNSIVSTSNGNIAITPNGTGLIVLDGLNWPSSDGSNGQVLTTNGTGTLSWTTITPGATTLDGLSDVVITAAATGDLLYFNGTNWVDQAASGLTVGIASTVTLTADNTTNATNYPLFANAATGNLSPRTDTGFTYNPSTGVLTAASFSGALNGTVGATTPSTGAFTTLSASTSASLKAVNEGAIFDLGTTGGTIAPNVANGNVQRITLNAALTINAFTSPVAGQTLTLIINGGTAYTSITSTMKFAGGIKTLTATAGCVDILTVYYDGTNYWASLGKDFK